MRDASTNQLLMDVVNVYTLIHFIYEKNRINFINENILMYVQDDSQDKTFF